MGNAGDGERDSGVFLPPCLSSLSNLLAMNPIASNHPTYGTISSRIKISISFFSMGMGVHWSGGVISFATPT
jgi:hypothetical protein